ncbi:SigE family RNA polymerase sigma factor [Micromonospora lupini]|uniref:RNA polymerase sigma factor n=1 Tax=Micromonospora lupini str. Lupac 08 TaxID=1150864 RepID=I0LBG4_9ACTN|nr:SigE family RNA polymerase sigma factor [Micromonospora lupini]CCH21161.1 RNA polymerase sigma factor [Micromonospora lupini str. Lupac 08]
MRHAQSFDEFYRSTARRMMRYGYAVSGDHTEAQDLVQEAFARAWRQWGRLSEHPAPEAWLRLVVSRLANDRWRHLHRWRVMASRSGPPPTAPPPSENGVLLVHALRQLPATQRQALALHYLFDMPIEEIAREAGVPLGTVKSWLSRGRSRLAVLLPDVHIDELEANDVS